MINLELKNKRILSFSAHPDDEVGGAGGLLLQAQNAGAEVRLVLCLDPAESRIDTSAEDERKARLKEFEEVTQVLKASSGYIGLPRYPRIEFQNILPLVKEIRNFRPDIVLTLSDQEYHPDHRAVAALTKEAIWQAGRNVFPEYGKPFSTKTLLQYEADNPMQSPDFLRDISDVMEQKRTLIEIYASQVRRKNLVDAVAGLNRFRGVMYKTGEYAEEFKVREFFYG